MANQPWEVWVELHSPHILKTYMTLKGETNMSLAIKCGSKSHRSTISHLRSGTRKTCGSEIARNIAKALGAPVEALFLVEMASGSHAMSHHYKRKSKAKIAA